jgi:hypothetical protein
LLYAGVVNERRAFDEVDLEARLHADRAPRDLTHREALEEVLYWRDLMRGLPDVVRYYLARIGEPCRVVTRQSRSYLGALSGVEFELAAVELLVDVVEWQPEEGGRYRETKTIRFPSGSVLQFETLREREPVRDEEHAGTDGAGTIPDIAEVL